MQSCLSASEGIMGEPIRRGCHLTIFSRQLADLGKGKERRCMEKEREVERKGKKGKKTEEEER